jgi:hypothetical protein
MRIFLRGTRDFEKHFRIKFRKPEFRVHPNGFVSATIDWSPMGDCENTSRFKYVDFAHNSFGGDFIVNKKFYINKRTVAFEFPALKDFNFSLFNMSSWFEISFGAENEEEDWSLEFSYEYLFFQSTKYGFIAWFAKEGWDAWHESARIVNGQFKIL